MWGQTLQIGLLSGTLQTDQGVVIASPALKPIQEIARREQLDNTTVAAADDGDYLEAIGSLFRANPAAFIEKHPSLANQLLLQQEKRREPLRDDIGSMSESELEIIATFDLKRFVLRTTGIVEPLSPEERVNLIREITAEPCRLCGGKPF